MTIFTVGLSVMNVSLIDVFHCNTLVQHIGQTTHLDVVQVNPTPTFL